MKKLFVIFCILVLVFPMCAFAARSATIERKIYSNPAVKFEVIDELSLIADICEMLPKEELKDYTWCEALIVELDKKYEEVKWYLPIDMSGAENVKIVIIGESVYIQETDIEHNMITVDFTDLEPGTYYVCFFIK